MKYEKCEKKSLLVFSVNFFVIRHDRGYDKIRFFGLQLTTECERLDDSIFPQTCCTKRSSDSKKIKLFSTAAVIIGNPLRYHSGLH